MKFVRALIDGWVSLVHSTWRAFLVFGGLIFLAAAYQSYTGAFAGKRFDQVVDDIAIGLILMFLASFVTAILYHWSVWRNRDRPRRRNRYWPGGGGPRRR